MDEEIENQKKEGSTGQKILDEIALWRTKQNYRILFKFDGFSIAGKI